MLCQKPIPSASPSTGYVCPLCLPRIEINAPPFCPICSRQRSTPIKHPYCYNCRTQTPHFDFAWSACIYAEPLRTLLHQYKFRQKTVLRHLFHRLIVNFIQIHQLDTHQFDWIMPIPLHPARQRERGYNQSELIARLLAKSLNRRISTRHLKRVRFTPAQSTLHQKERWTNLDKAFRIRHFKSIRKTSILLVDDLLTTGATTSAAAQALKQAGAGRVGVLTLAIAADNRQ